MTYEELVQTVAAMQQRIEELEKLVHKRTSTVSFAGAKESHREYYEKKMESLKEGK